jgi:hypothetical protein
LEAKEHKLKYSKHFLTEIVSKTLNFQILSFRVLKKKFGERGKTYKFYT